MLLSLLDACALRSEAQIHRAKCDVKMWGWGSKVQSCGHEGQEVPKWLTA